jgi:3-hydroxy-9,10-secoandrosta-1,3,5(10)-triene-9,17-dione monooxygenase
MSKFAAEGMTVLRPVAHADDWLPQDELAALTPADLADRVIGLLPLLSEHTAETERLRRPVDAVWAALRRSGVFYHFVPKKYGGLEFGLADFLEAMLPLGAACASTAWVTTFCVEHNWLLAQFPEQAQDEIFADFPYIIAPGTNAPPGTAVPAPGGYRVSGRWRWGTGVTHADWAIVSAVTPGGPPGGSHCIVPIADVVILDTWRMDGMIGTGSNDIVLDDVFVPAHRVCSFADVKGGRGNGSRLYDNPVYRLPFLPFLALTAAIPVIGAARGAIDHYRALITAGMVAGTDSRKADRPPAQMRLARACLVVDTAEQVLRDVVRMLDQQAASPDPTGTVERMRERARIAHAVDLCRGAVAELCAASGSSAHQVGNPLQRSFRDVNTMASHVVFDMDIATEGYGRTLLGLQPNSPIDL